MKQPILGTMALALSLMALAGCGGNNQFTDGHGNTGRSPDILVFSSNRTGNTEIYRMDSDGLSVLQLTFNDAFDFQPTLAPDRSQVVFTSDRDGDNELYLMNANGSNVERLTNNSADDSDPAFSPDGEHIAYISNRNGARSDEYDLYTLNINTGTIVRLTDTPGHIEFSPCWSPDGRFLAYAVQPIGSTNTDIYTIRLSDRSVARLTTHSAEDDSPSWSPDGNRIAFATNRDGNFNVYEMDDDGANVDRITTNTAQDGFPVYSRDGRYIYFDSRRDGDSEIMCYDRDTADVVYLTDNVDADTNPDTRAKKVDPSRSLKGKKTRK